MLAVLGRRYCGFPFAFFTFFVLFVYGRAILAFQSCFPRTSQTDGKRLTPICLLAQLWNPVCSLLIGMREAYLPSFAESWRVHNSPVARAVITVHVARAFRLLVLFGVCAVYFMFFA